MIYEKWKYHARLGKEILSDEASQDELNELIENIETSCSALKAIYEEQRRVQTPEQDLRRRIDACISLSGFIVRRAQRQREAHAADEEKEPWPDVGSILDSTGSLLRPVSHQSKCSSTHSSVHSVKRNEAVAEAAASQEVLAVLEEQEREASELQKLEVESKQRLAQFEFEDLARQQAMQDKRRKLERLEEVKKLNAARARVKVYDQVEGNFDAIDSLHDAESAEDFQVPPFTRPQYIPQSLPAKPQVLQASSPPFIPQSLPAMTQVLQALSPPFISQSLPVTSQVHNIQSLQQVSQIPSASVLMPQLQNSPDLVSALAEAMSANRLPMPEPALFTGDPLKFKD
ncbi:inner centromere -like protein [Labeo rohita]|uniref:Inner centromere-like protein n=1 Tax=Labeo rohita TaxID=84645 RepID=A0A498LZW8_LABRO|nr:inner centromere -like protein [Labeo rohita]RXN37539.1 inner centromere -like protein [Labeo rohita]